MVATSDADFKLPITCYHKSAMMFTLVAAQIASVACYVCVQMPESDTGELSVISTEIKHRNPVPCHIGTGF